MTNFDKFITVVFSVLLVFNIYNWIAYFRMLYSVRKLGALRYVSDFKSVSSRYDRLQSNTPERIIMLAIIFVWFAVMYSEMWC